MFARLTLLASILAAEALTAAVSAQDAVVPDDFATISQAVASATDADGNGSIEIFVQSGVYHESVIIRRDDVALIGAGAGSTLIVGSDPRGAVQIRRADRVELAGFTVHNDAGDGIELRRATGCHVHANVVIASSEGIRVNRSNDNVIEANEASGNGSDGIKLSRSVGNHVVANLTQGNGSHGISLDRCDDTAVDSNICAENGSDGIRVRRSAGTDIVDNVCSGNRDNGLRMRDTEDTIVDGNAFDANDEWGIRLRDGIGDDFDATAAGPQGPLGNNGASGNDKGAVRVD